MPLVQHDTLTEFHPADSLAGAAADTLFLQAPEPVAVPLEIWDAAAVYGPHSETVVNGFAETVARQSALTGNMWFQIVTLIALGLYCLMIYYYREQVWMCLKGMITVKTENKFTAEHGHLYSRFIGYAMALCTLSVGIALTKAAAAWTDPQTIAALPKWIVPLTSIGLWALVVVIVAFQSSILRAAGKLTFSGKLTDLVTETKNTHLAAAALFVTPAVLLWSGVNPVWDRIMMWVIAAEGAILLISFLFRTFLLFVHQKVSLLVWILYLCAVEIFPVALVWVLAVKNF